MSANLLFARDDIPHVSALLNERDEWGLRTLDLVNPPRRFWADQNFSMPAVELGVDARRVRRLATPAELLNALPPGDNWQALSRRSVARLQSYFLICEDPQRRMDARQVETLAHQVSLVRHVLDDENLRKVLIADEVGLGKTVEVGLLIKDLLESQPGLRVLYLAPARLVSNVRREFERLDLHFRQWSSGDSDARLTDYRIIASIHRAAHKRNAKAVTETMRWDVLVVDECHHLSAWEPGGGDPREAYKLVRELIKRQSPDGRVIFLSGTPHQGNITRFENLLRLICGESESVEALSGRVIYRIKDDIRDWNNKQLFPPRQVNEPLVVDLGQRYRAWIEHIHAFYRPPRQENAGAMGRQRAAGWRCAQALQWAASSPQAGLGYLVRQAVRAKWDLSNKTLKQAMAALRPYRLGPLDEPIDQLFTRIEREVFRQQQNQDVEDIEDDEGEAVLRGDTAGLEKLLSEGLGILSHSADEKWQFVKKRLLDMVGDEKVVLFAQPIETVVALARFLERETGYKPALVIGGQSDGERQKEIDSFRRSDGPQFLVSSRAGGEGINLQVARRLIHIDVPWNPMDMEQRVGRVHRFGSRRTIIVDTIVVKDSREASAYRIARQKLEIIAATLVEPERFESIFARVMCLVPPEELQTVLIHGSQAPFNAEDQEQIAQLVQRGYRAWKEFHERYGDQQKLIRQQDAGIATWDDFGQFLQAHAKARSAQGFTSKRFVENQSSHDSLEEKVSVLTLEDGANYVCGETVIALVSGPEGVQVHQLGLNLKVVADVLRSLAFPQSYVGAAYLRWSHNLGLPPHVTTKPFGVLIFMKQRVRTDPRAGWVEQGSTLHCFVLELGKEPVALGAVDKGLLLRGIIGAVVQSKPEPAEALCQFLGHQEIDLANELRRPTEEDLEQGVRHAVTPLLAALIS